MALPAKSSVKGSENEEVLITAIKLSKNWLHKFAEKYFLNEDLEIMKYGFYVFISKIIFIEVIIIVGTIFGELESILFFTLFYVPWRDLVYEGADVIKD